MSTVASTRPYDGVGIDFGTTNSVVATSRRGSPALLNRALTGPDGRPHPSVVWYRLDGDGVRVGREAKESLLGFSEAPGNQFISSVKRSLGRDACFSIFGRKVGATKIAADIFEFLRRDAKEHHDLQLDQAIVTIPVSFDGRARRELRQAADQAGIYIKTFVHEPFAAVVGHCYQARGFRPLEQREGEVILVFDWGGGTLDVTICRVESGSIVELGNAGFSDRSGDYFDARLGSYLKTGFAARHSIPAEQMAIQPGTKDRLRSECERGKIQLSSELEHLCAVQKFLRHGQTWLHLKEPITRAGFEELIRGDVRQAVSLVDEVVEKAGLRDTDVDMVLLIGGTSRIPLLRGEMHNRFGTKLVPVENADTIIAEGAAVVDALGLYPALARPICVELSDGSDYEIFAAGDLAKADLCSKEVVFYCTDNRDGQARLVIKEGTSRDGTRGVTKLVLPVPVSPRLPKPYNHERVVARFVIDDDLILRVSARGSILPEGARGEVFDLRFALRSYGVNDER